MTLLHAISDPKVPIVCDSIKGKLLNENAYKNRVRCKMTSSTRWLSRVFDILWFWPPISGFWYFVILTTKISKSSWNFDTWPHLDNLGSALAPSHRELSNASSFVSLRPFVRELWRGGVYPPPPASRGWQNTPATAGLTSTCATLSASYVRQQNCRLRTVNYQRNCIFFRTSSQGSRVLWSSSNRVAYVLPTPRRSQSENDYFKGGGKGQSSQ